MSLTKKDLNKMCLENLDPYLILSVFMSSFEIPLKLRNHFEIFPKTKEGIGSIYTEMLYANA